MADRPIYQPITKQQAADLAMGIMAAGATRRRDRAAAEKDNTGREADQPPAKA